MKSIRIHFYSFICMLTIYSNNIASQPLMENLDRGVVAVKEGKNVFVSWRLLGFEPEGVGFNVYRIDKDQKHKKLNKKPIYNRT